MMEDTSKNVFKFEYENSLNLFGEIKKMVVAVKLPTGATEIIINTENIQSKYEYYLSAYDEEMKLKTNSDIQIVGCMFV